MSALTGNSTGMENLCVCSFRKGRYGCQFGKYNFYVTITSDVCNAYRSFIFPNGALQVSCPQGRVILWVVALKLDCLEQRQAV